MVINIFVVMKFSALDNLFLTNEVRVCVGVYGALYYDAQKYGLFMCFSCDAELLFILGNMMVPAFK
jgi:hypothetical protein